MNPFLALWRSTPYILLGAVLGIILYNPAGFSLVALSLSVFLGGLGHVENVSWYFQPAIIAVLFLLLIFAGFVMFNWETARNEKKYFVVFVLGLMLGNLLLLGFGQILGSNWLSLGWFEWQAAPDMFAALVFAAMLPRVRRSYNSSVTSGGGSIDTIEEQGGDDHYHH